MNTSPTTNQDKKPDLEKREMMKLWTLAFMILALFGLFIISLAGDPDFTQVAGLTITIIVLSLLAAKAA